MRSPSDCPQWSANGFSRTICVYQCCSDCRPWPPWPPKHRSAQTDGVRCEANQMTQRHIHHISYHTHTHAHMRWVCTSQRSGGCIAPATSGILASVYIRCYAGVHAPSAHSQEPAPPGTPNPDEPGCARACIVCAYVSHIERESGDEPAT